jgi:peptidoglycan-N-acetylglucosamine deacetylase
MELMKFDQEDPARLQEALAPALLNRCPRIGVPDELRTENQARASWPRQAIRWGLARALPSSMLLVRGPRRDRSVCLTFDDGPDPVLTPPLLDVLRDLGVRATFFVIGCKVERYPGIVRRMAAEGHCVGNHSFHHSDPASISARQLCQEVRRTAELLAGLLGHEVRFCRPPHGKLSALKLLSLWGAKQTVVLWTVDPKDYCCKSAENLRSWFHARSLRGGDVVLMHDNVPHAVEIIPDVVQQARASGLTFSTVADWLS